MKCSECEGMGSVVDMEPIGLFGSDGFTVKHLPCLACNETGQVQVDLAGYPVELLLAIESPTPRSSASPGG